MHIKSHQVLLQAYVGPIIHTINFVLPLDKSQGIYKGRRLEQHSSYFKWLFPPSVWKPTGFANIWNTKAAKIHLSSGSSVPRHPTALSLGLLMIPPLHKVGEQMHLFTGSGPRPEWCFALRDRLHHRKLSSLLCCVLSSGTNSSSIDTTAVLLMLYRNVVSLCLVVHKCFDTKALKLRDRYLLGPKSKTTYFCHHECFIGNFSFRNEEPRPWPHKDTLQTWLFIPD